MAEWTPDGGAGEALHHSSEVYARAYNYTGEDGVVVKLGKGTINVAANWRTREQTKRLLEKIFELVIAEEL